MKQRLLFFLIFLSGTLLAQTPQKYFVRFSDKGNSGYTIANPSAYLSPRALTRRANQNISIDSLDLPVTPAYANAVAATGAQILSRSKWFNGVIVIADSMQQTAIQNLPFVLSSDNVGQRRPGDGENKFNDTFSPVGSERRTGAMSTQSLNYGGSFDQVNMLGGVCLHNAGFRGEGLVIAVLDAGFFSVDTMIAFDTLRYYNRILGTWDFVQNNASVYEDSQHGTMVLSCMGGNLPGQLVGTAPEASYWLLRSEDANTEYIVEEYFWASAAEFADSVGADIINSSLGYTQFDNPAQNHVFATDMDGNTCPSSVAADFAAAKGVAVVASAGNSGASPWRMIGAPADADSILTIGAVDATETIAVFSSHGFSADGDVKPNVVAMGQGSIVAAPGGTVWSGNGTSFSSPITAGLVACLWQAHPGLTNMQLLQNIEMSADRYATPDTLYGYGVPDFCAANITLGGSGGMTFSEENQLLDLGPNPFSDFIRFSYFAAVPQEIHVELFDLRGRQLMHEVLEAKDNSLNKFTVRELETVVNGVYLLRITTATERITRKLVKQ